MSYFKNFANRGALALSILTLCAGCATSVDPGRVAVAPVIPELPDRLREQCRDPGVDPDAIVALTENRVALAECRRLHRETVQFYSDTRRGLAGTPR